MRQALLDYYPLLIPLAPLLAALLTSRPSRVGARSYRIAWWGFVAGFAVAVEVLFELLLLDAKPIRMELFDSPWHFLPTVALTIDRLAAIMLVLISGIGTLLYRYSIRYLQQDPAQPRYHTLLAVSISTLLFMVTSSDLVMIFISWQLLSWLLCLLSHNYAHNPTAQSSFRTFIMLRLGDVAFLAGIALAYKLYGTVELSELFTRAAADSTVFTLVDGLTMRGSTAVVLLIFVGAMSKSAQFPLHMWLPDSLYAPTPIHGLLHAGIINAGGFLLNRLAPMYASSTPTLHFVFVVGLVTTIVGTAMMLVQNDIKKSLGYSTIGQMGFMIMECGLGAFSMAVFHLAAHGLFKATIFLNCGNIIHEARLHPASPPQAAKPSVPSASGWVVGFLMSLALPFGILMGVHELLGIDLKDSQGLQIFLFFSWITASHAMLTLYRVRKTGPIAQGWLLIAITMVAAAYLFAAELFTYFLYPDPRVVEFFFDAAAMPNGVFYGIMGFSVLLMGAAWMASYRQRLGVRSRPSSLRMSVYLILMNRLYLDGVALRVHGALKRTVQAFDRSRYIGAAIAAALVIAIAVVEMTESPAFSGNVGLVLLAALLMPLFPLHGLYIAAVTRTPKTLGVLVAFVMPLISIGILIAVLPKVPAAILPALKVLALGGAVYGSLKALVQPRALQVLAYGGLALYSILWWHIASVGGITPQAALFATSAAVVLGGLSMAWACIRGRFGDLSINEMGGLFSQMPRFSLCMALLVMAASGLPPFGLFFGYLGMLTAAPASISLSSGIIFFAWFAASYYMFRLMQRLLFGPHRVDFLYEDLRFGEQFSFVVVIASLVILGAVPQEWAQTVVVELARAFGGTL